MSPTKVGSTTGVLTFTLTLSSMLTSTDYFVITIPSPGALTSSSISCAFSIPTTMTVSQCTGVISGSYSTITIQGSAPTSSTFLVKFTVSYLTNPSSTASLTLTAVRYNTGGTVETDSSLTLGSFTAATMASATITPSTTSDNYVGISGATVKFSFVTSN